MRFTPQQHMKAAVLMHSKAKAAKPENQKELLMLANAHRLLARKANRKKIDEANQQGGPVTEPKPNNLTEPASQPPTPSTSSISEMLTPSELDALQQSANEQSVWMRKELTRRKAAPQSPDAIPSSPPAQSDNADGGRT